MTPPRAGGPTEPDGLARLTMTEHDGVARGRLEGEIDISNVGDIEAQLNALPNEVLGLVLDLRATTFIDSSAVSLLHGMRSRLRRRGQMLRIVVPLGTAPRRVLELTGYEHGGPLDLEAAAAEGVIRAAAARPQGAVGGAARCPDASG